MFVGSGASRIYGSSPSKFQGLRLVLILPEEVF